MALAAVSGHPERQLLVVVAAGMGATGQGVWVVLVLVVLGE